ncbi:hypothetical protein C8F01DRAFT_1117636 [Mycena amicta]|nr:hypothetical protein C8F01DRAFT_1117636 [Mycena amicta]
MTLYICALLGTPPGESGHIKEQLWFISDLLFAQHLLAEEADGAHQVWMTQFDVYKVLKANYPTSSHTLLHGPFRSDRFKLNDRTPFYERWLSGPEMKRVFLATITRFARPAKARDHLVILLFGHGDDDIATLGRVQCGEAEWLHPKEVERALGTTRARVSIISTACFAASWVNPAWGLFAAARREFSVGLPASESDRMWASTFWTTVAELAANSHCCTFHTNLIHPQSDFFEPPLNPQHLQVLSGSDGQGALPLNDPTHTLSSENLRPAFTAASANTTPEAVAAHDWNPLNGASFEPTIPENAQWGGWHVILGIQQCIDIVLGMNRLAWQPANPPNVQVDVPLVIGSAVRRRSRESSVSVMPGSESAVDHSEEWGLDVEDFAVEEGMVDPQSLLQMVNHWETVTRPLNLHIGARPSLYAVVQRYRAGTATRVEELKLGMQFQQRSQADSLAQTIAEKFGIALRVRCEEYQEVDMLRSWCNIPFVVIDWGSVSPRDVVGGLRLRYKKAGQWLYTCWRESAKDQDVLKDILLMINGRIYDELIQKLA